MSCPLCSPTKKDKVPTKFLSNVIDEWFLLNDKGIYLETCGQTFSALCNIVPGQNLQLSWQHYPGKSIDQCSSTVDTLANIDRAWYWISSLLYGKHRQGLILCEQFVVPFAYLHNTTTYLLICLPVLRKLTVGMVFLCMFDVENYCDMSLPFDKTSLHCVTVT